MMRLGRAALCGAAMLVASLATRARAQQPAGDWRAYGRDAGGSRYSPLTQITRANVKDLAPAWTFHTGELGVDTRHGRPPALEVTPLVVDGTMYLNTPLGRVYALDAATGAVKWRYDAGIDPTKGYGDFASRGLAYWRARVATPADTVCAERLFVAAIDARLIALDATSGAPCTGFGESGVIDLRRGLRIAPFEFQAYEMTSPPTIVRDLVITGSAIADNSRPDPASGEVRAWDVRTGALKWSFEPIPQDTTDVNRPHWLDSSSVTSGGANVWSVIAADPGRDLVFLPTSSPAPDYFGGLRIGDNRYANSIVALQASTGQVKWHFQTVHHDLWDYDNASPPALAIVRGQPAVLQATKSGMLFVLNRETGKPIVPVYEYPVAGSDIPGEWAWPTQPYSFELQLVKARELVTPWGPAQADRDWCKARMDSLIVAPDEFIPPSTQGTLVIPSNVGGAHWGGVAADETRGIAVVPVNRVATVVQLIAAEGLDGDSVRREDAARGMSDWEMTRMRETPFFMRRTILRGPSGMPCTPPPFGALIGVNLARGRIAWQVPLGTWPLPANSDSAEVARGELGSLNLGGPIVTASGVVFIGATLDRTFRAFDIETGKTLWRAELSAGARATPMTYAVRGRQFVVIAAGGAGPFGPGDQIVAYALPPR
ncbi:MAG TPA: pyrroloquinoline quinone-dependent dehydrogenase [Gemmatimonadaceae bacterium]|nr:pyrroloquinoline quinone-dependent dehydrogenase [Gemmatimonadaceae bacterium]